LLDRMGSKLCVNVGYFILILACVGTLVVASFDLPKLLF